jgi:hypothetical protein
MIRNNRIVEAKGDKKQQTKEQKFRQYKLPWHLHGDNFLSSFIYYMDCSVDIVLHVKFKYLFARFMCHYNSLHQIKK